MSLPATNRGLPWMTPVLAAVACVARVAGLGEALEDHADLAGEFWRPVTAHLAHGSTSHLALNLLLFLPLAAIYERRRGSWRFLADLTFVGLLVAAAVRLVHPEWTSYRGLSGVVYGLAVLVLVAPAGRRPGPGDGRGWALAVLVALAGKTALETHAGGWLHGAGVLDEAFRVRFLPGSHLGGLAGGALLALLQEAQARRARVAAPGSDASRIAPTTATPAAPASRT